MTANFSHIPIRFRAVSCVVAVAFLSGCNAISKLPPGTQLQSSTFGLKISPQAIDATPFALGSHTTIITTAQPADGGVGLNRFEGSAPGVNVRSTVTSGPIGSEIEKAGGVPALEVLLRRAGTDATSSTTPVTPE